MSPTRIMIIRHAEKPVPDGADGIAPDGSPDPESLSAIGWERARKLVGFFSAPTARDIEKPNAVIAAAPDNASKRPAETVTPLVDAMWPPTEGAQPFDQSIRKENVDGLAQAVMATNGVLLVAWEHKLIPAAVAALPNAPATPTKWPGDRFDVVWILEPDGDGWAFRQTPQMLMPDDQDSVIAVSRHGAD